MLEGQFGRLGRSSALKAVRVAALGALIASPLAAQADANDHREAGFVAPGHQRSTSQPFQAALLERKKLDDGVRVRLLIFTRSVHERDGVRVWVFANELDRSAYTQERRKCGCDGLWVVDSGTRRGRKLLRGLRAKLREKGRARFGAMARGEDPVGPAAGFRITDYNQKFRPYEGTT